MPSAEETHSTHTNWDGAHRTPSDHLCVRVCVHACVFVCMCACVCVCVCVCACVWIDTN